MSNRYYEDNQVKEDEMGRECGMHGGQVVGFWLGNLKERATERRWENTPVFEKRSNFLNSVPTSKEGALRLLSAPSGRF